MLKESRSKIFSILLITLMLFSIVPIFSKASGISDILVGSDVEINQYLRQEMFVYKANDADPLYDYYFVEIHMWELLYDWDVWTEIWGITTYFIFEAVGSSGEIALETYREPDPGFRWWEGYVDIIFYGFVIPVWLPAGRITFFYNGMPKYPVWNVEGMPATRSHATFAIGFRVKDGSQVKVYGNCYAEWYFFWIFGITLRASGWGRECYVTYTP